VFTHPTSTQSNSFKPVAHNLFVIAGRITHIFMNYGCQWVQDILVFLRCFCSASIRLFGHLSTKYADTVQKEFVLVQGHHKLYFISHVHGRHTFLSKPACRSHNPGWSSLCEAVTSLAELLKLRSVLSLCIRWVLCMLLLFSLLSIACRFRHRRSGSQAAVDGLPTSAAKGRSLFFEISGEGNLPRVAVARPSVRNRSGEPVLLFQRLVLGRSESLPLLLRNEGTLPCKVRTRVGHHC